MRVRRQSNGERITLSHSRLLGKGGEACIYRLAGHAALAAKLYHKPTQEHSEKLAVMVANPWNGCSGSENRSCVAWPVDLLQTDDSAESIAGFLMPEVRGMQPVFNFYSPQTRRQVCPRFTYQYLHRMARNIAAVARLIHKKGCVIADINESNVMADDRGLITWVDSDSFQVRDPRSGRVFRCTVGKPDFTPPELQRLNLGSMDRTVAHDQFGLAVVIFRLLMEGTHPFDAVFKGQGEPPSLEARISSGHFPYSVCRIVPYAPKPLAPPLEVLCPKVRRLFVQCFEEGHDHPSSRPEPATWVRALEEAEAALVVCPTNSQHTFGNHLKKCPWCERTLLLRGRDPFPGSHEAGIRPLRFAHRSLSVPQRHGRRHAKQNVFHSPRFHTTPTFLESCARMLLRSIRSFSSRYTKRVT